jgi:hypothetical protein
MNLTLPQAFGAQGTLGNQNANALVQRACTVIIGFPGTNQGIQIVCGNGTGLDVAFNIQRGLHTTTSSLKPQPNTCDLKLYGLNPDHRKALAKFTGIPAALLPKTTASGTTTQTPGQAPPIPCIITAGYQQRQTVLFSGELRACQDISEGPDVITEVSSGDGDKAITQSRINLAIPPGATMQTVFNQIVAAFGGIQSGNLQKMIGQIQSNPMAQQLFSKGCTLKGSAAEILSDLCRSTGFQWSVQNGALSIVPLGQPLDGEATLIDENHGMLGVPSVDTKGIVTVRTLMIPGIMPGSKITIPSINATGGFRVIGQAIDGDTSIGSTSWGFTLNAQVY